MYVSDDKQAMAQVVSRVSNIWIGPWANFPPYMDPTFNHIEYPFSNLKGTSRGPESLHSHLNDYYYTNVLC